MREYSKQETPQGVGFISIKVINDGSHENPGTPGTKLKDFGNNLQICATLPATGCTTLYNLIHHYTRLYNIIQ